MIIIMTLFKEEAQLVQSSLRSSKKTKLFSKPICSRLGRILLGYRFKMTVCNCHNSRINQKRNSGVRKIVKMFCFTIRLEIISKRGIIARLSYNTSFGLYEKVDVLTFFNFLAATQQVACYRSLHRAKLFSSIKTWAINDPPLW